MSYTLYEYAVLYAPKPVDKNTREMRPRLIVPITSVIAASEDEARTVAARAIPTEYAGQLGEVEILVRPFE